MQLSLCCVFLLSFGAVGLVLGCGAPPSSPPGDAPGAATGYAEDLTTSSFGNALSRAEVRVVLGLIDNVCGDIWCEGDYDFRFRNLFCDASAQACTLMFQTALRDVADSARNWRWQTCLTGGFVDFDSLVTTSGDYRWLSAGYYQALDACIEPLANDGDSAR